MNSRFICMECDRTTEKFIATIEGPEGVFDGILEYCHFCDLGFYKLSPNHIELVEIERTVISNLQSPSSESLFMQPS